MAETDAPMFQSTRSMKREMDEILSEKQDPVSGNTAPIGATPAEVRDDIPIMASPNEFMIDAATRRYYGTPFFENLQAAAKQGFKRIKAGEESFFRDDELEVEQEAQKMNEGGEVDTIENREIPAPMGGGYFGAGGTGSLFTGFEFKIYIDPTTGREIQIIFFNGRPLSPIPDGFVLKADTPVEAQEQKRIADDDPTPDPRDEFKTWKNKQANTWKMEDYRAYINDMSKLPPKEVGVPNNEENFIVKLLGDSLGGGLGEAATALTNRLYRQKADNINNEINKMLKSGLDADGNSLTRETNNILFQAQLAAQQTNENLGGKQTVGTPIYEQEFYQTPEGEIDIEKLMPPEVDFSSIPEPTEEEKAAAQEVMERNKPF